MSPESNPPIQQPVAEDLTRTIDFRSAEAGQTEIGPYRLIRQLGEGGMGVVYQAQQTQPIRREVALKIIKPGMDSRQVVARFESERQALALMDHPNIARVYDAGTTAAGLPYFAMELVDGIPITRYCDTKRLTLKERIDLFIPVCKAIQHAHQKGIIHRDIKPSNVLVMEQDGKPAAKVIDFGLAKALGNRLSDDTMMTNLGTVVGTLEYMSPEQAELSRQDVDTRSDIYSLGVLLYELMTGTTPLGREYLTKAAYVEVLRAIREEDPVAPSARVRLSGSSAETAVSRRTNQAHLPRLLHRELDWITMKALEKDRARRYETVNGFVRELERYLSGEPVEAGPPSATYRMMKMARKHGVALGTAAAFVALLAGAAIFSTTEAIRARRAERVAEAVNGFLQNDLLAQASSGRQGGPDTKPDPDIKVRTALDRAAAGVGGRFAGQPEVEASLRRTIGLTYQDLGLTGPARKQVERALELLRAGGNKKNALAASAQLASLEIDEGRFADAEALARQTLAEQRRLLGPRDPALFETMDVLGQAWQKQDKFAEAEKMQRELLELRLAAGSDSRDTLNTELTLGAIYRGESKRKEAEATDREVLEKARQTLGAEHPLTLTAMANLAEDYARDSKFPEALELATQTLEIKRRVLGPDHPETIAAIGNLAGNYWLAGKYPESEKMYLQVVDAFTKLKGPEHPDTLESEQNLASALINERRFPEAQVLLERVLPQQVRVSGAGHELSLNAADMLSKVYSIQGKHAQAEAIQVAAVDAARKNLGPTHAQTLGLMNNLALVYRNENKLAEAEKIQTEVVKGEREKNGPEHPDTLFVLTNLAIWKALQHKNQEAIDVIRPVLEIRVRKTPDHWQRFRCEYLLGSYLASDKQFAEAETHLRNGFEGLMQRRTNIPADALVNIPNCARDLAKMFRAQGKSGEAAQWEARLREPAIASLVKP